MRTRTNQEWVETLRGDLGIDEQTLAYEDLGEYIFRINYKMLRRYRYSKPILRHSSQEQLKAEARNLAQDGLEKIFAKKLYDQYKEQKGAKFTSYIAKITVLDAIQAFRNKINNLESLPFSHDKSEGGEYSKNIRLPSYERVKDEDPIPEGLIEQKDVWTIILQCIEALPEPRKNAFRLNVLEGLPAKTVKTELKLASVQALYNLINRARKQIRICVELGGWQMDEIKQIFS